MKTVEELEVMIEQVQQQIEKKAEEIQKIGDKKETQMSKKDKKKAQKLILEEVDKLEYNLRYMTSLRLAKIPFWQKLDKSSAFYIHYVQLLYNGTISEACKDIKDHDTQMMS